MSSKHTPPPWSIRHGTNIFATRRDVGHEGCICNTGSHSSNIRDCGPENEANARLIAAAPELLEACKALLCMLDRGGEPRKIDEALTWRENDEKARKMAVDAIRKATGEATGESSTSPR